MENNQQATKVIKYLIQSCPIGEEREVLDDIEKLQPVDYSLFEEDLRKHNQDHLAILTNESERIVVFNAAYQDGRYYDQVTNKAYTVDHQNATIVNVEDYESNLSESAREFLLALHQGLKNYLVKYFKENQALQVVSNEDGSEIRIALTAKNLNFNNFYGGEWVSTWTLSGNSLEGSAQVNAHFFEAGNVQLHQSKALGPVQINEDDVSKRVSAVVLGIEKLEGSLQRSLSELYEEVPEKFFKSLRRVIPFTKMKMDWNVAALSIKQNLQNMTKPAS